MDVEPDNSDPIPKTSPLKYQDDSNYVVKSWEERLEEYKRLFAKSNTEQDVRYSRMADLEILPPEIHEDLLRAVLFYQQFNVFDDSYQPELFHVTPEMKKKSVAMVLQDSLYFSIYFTYIANSINWRFVGHYFEYAYEMFEDEVRKLYPRFYLTEIFKDFIFSHFGSHIIVYPKKKEDIKKIHGLIRLNQLDLGIHHSSIFYDEVKFLDKGFAFHVGPQNDLDLEEIIEVLSPYEFSLVQSTVIPFDIWSDRIFDRLTTDKLEIFLGNRYRRDDGNILLSFDRKRDFFKVINLQTKEKKKLEELSVDLTITHPNVNVYTVHPDILTIHSDYEVPVNAYDIASFSIDRKKYELPEVQKELMDGNLTQLIERCREERVNKYIDGK